MTSRPRQKQRTANKGFAIAGVPCFADTFVQGENSVLRMKFTAKTPRHRKPPKRYRQCNRTYVEKTIIKYQNAISKHSNYCPVSNFHIDCDVNIENNN